MIPDNPLHFELYKQGFTEASERELIIDTAKGLCSPVALGQLIVMLTTMTPEEFKRKAQEIHETVEKMKAEHNDT